MSNLEYKGYYGSIEYDKGSKCLTGKVLGMTKDCILYEGRTIGELEEDFQNAVDSYLEGCEELGIKPRKGYNGVLNIRIPSDVHIRIARVAETTGTTINSFIRDSIERRLEHAQN
jgi:predicted HicB family RNase H-like nuclease